MPSTHTVRRIIKPLVFVVCLLPLVGLAVGAFGIGGASLGADPVARLLHELGEWALRLLVITLAITPLRFIFGQPWLIGLRRMLGLFGFTYVLLHFLVWLTLDQGLYWGGILTDIGKRPFITLGFAAFLMLIPLAVTSTNKMMRRLGRNWQRLHRLIYVIVPLGVWHFYWLVKKDVTEPLIYAAITAFLLGYRYWRARRRQSVAA